MDKTDTTNDKINIQCSEDENGEYNINVDISNFLDEFEKLSTKKSANHMMDQSQLYAEISNYDMNYTVKQLNMICDYYGITKQVGNSSKMKKQDYIEKIIIFENNPENIIEVLKRKQYWQYLDELKMDKYFKKFILW
jgi:hypothetical protein